MSNFGQNPFRRDDLFSSSIKYRSSNLSLNKNFIPSQGLKNIPTNFQYSDANDMASNRQQNWNMKHPVSENLENHEISDLVSSVVSNIFKLSKMGISYVISSVGDVKNSYLSAGANEGLLQENEHEDLSKIGKIENISLSNNFVMPGSYNFDMGGRTNDTANRDKGDSTIDSSIDETFVHDIKRYEDSMLNGQFYTDNFQSPLLNRQKILYDAPNSSSINYSGNKEEFQKKSKYTVTPLKWDEEEEIISEDDVLVNQSTQDSDFEYDMGKSQYGTSLFHKQTKRSSPDIEAEYYRKIFNENYQPPPISADDLEAISADPSFRDHPVSNFFNMTEIFRSLFTTDESAHNTEIDTRNKEHLKESQTYASPRPISKFSAPTIDTSLTAFQEEFKTYQSILEEKRKRQQLIQLEKTKYSSKVKPLTSDQLTVVHDYWNSYDSGDIVSTQFSIDLTVKDLKTLSDGRWLNDNIIDFYFSLITERSKNAAEAGLDVAKVYGFSTHFYTQLKQKGYAGVARWAKRKKIDVTKQSYIFVPVNIGNAHWALAVINNKEKKFQYYDSLQSGGTISTLEKLQDYMIQEGKRLSSPIDFKEYTFQTQVKCPQQENGFDCGVFTCTNAETLSREKTLFFSQADMKVIRRRMAFEIVEQNLIEAV